VVSLQGDQVGLSYSCLVEIYCNFSGSLAAEEEEVWCEASKHEIRLFDFV